MSRTRPPDAVYAQVYPYGRAMRWHLVEASLLDSPLHAPARRLYRYCEVVRLVQRDMRLRRGAPPERDGAVCRKCLAKLARERRY